MADNNATPQITFAGKVTAGILLVCFTLFSITVLIAFWPDRMPEPAEKCALYQYSLFNMRLDTGACGEQAMTTLQHIHLNTILLIMVAAAGFLGNMIHIATSFTTYVGSGSFQKSWILWYWVRPFTASALALALYLAFGATNNPGSVDLDRTLTIAILAGLFTDTATQKLKEVFDVVFKPKDNRPDKLTDTDFSIAKEETEPETLVKETDNTIVIYGKKLTTKKLVINMEDTPITNASTTDNQISFTYAIPDDDKDKEKLVLVITDEAGKEVYRKDFPVQGNSSDTPEVDTGEDVDADEKPVG